MYLKRLSWPLLTAVLLLTLSCSQELVEKTMDDSSTDVEVSGGINENNYHQGIVVVKFTEEMASLIGDQLCAGSTVTKSSSVNEIFENYGVISARRVFPDDERWIERQHREGLHLWYVIEFDEDAAAATKAADGFAGIEGVEIAEPSLKIVPCAMNDEYYSDQWHLHSDYDINVEEVWANYTTGDPSVIVSVVDTGIDFSHPDLQQALIPAGEDGSWNFYRDSDEIFADDHGTHVAGIIAATSNNSIGVAGIAGGDYAAGKEGVRILSCEIFDEDYADASNPYEAAAIVHGADNGALISQNSWGGSYETEEEARATPISSVLVAAIDYFIKYAGCDNAGNQLPDSKMKGGIVVFAAGNDGIGYDPLASYEPVIAVGSVNPDGTRAHYSNYGDWVDICAPGTDIMSTLYDQTEGSTYQFLSGTSMACPMVSGVAALVISCAGGQGFTADDLKKSLLSGASYDKVSAADVGPFVDALGAVEAAIGGNNAPEAVAEMEDVLLVSGSYGSEVIDMSKYFSDPDGDELTYTVANTSPGIVSSEVTSCVLVLAAGSSGSAEITVTATDSRGNSADQTFRVIVRASGDSVILYPNPCQDYLYVSTLYEEETYIMISSSTGTKVYEATMNVSAFDPACIDMSSLAPGRYSVYVSYSGTEVTRTVVKI